MDAPNESVHNMTRRHDIVGIGESMLTFRRSACGDKFDWEIGGAESNVLRYCAALGAKPAWVSRVGQDLAGDLVVNTIAQAGVDTSQVTRVPRYQTGIMVKERSTGTQQVRYYRRDSAASTMSEHNVDLRFLRSPRILHLTGITLALSESCQNLVGLLLDREHRHTTSGPKLAFDVNWRPTIWAPENSPGEELRKAANRADIAFVGLDEANEVWNASKVGEVRKLLPGPEMLFIKDAERGAYAIVGSETHFIKALCGPVVEPIGAGDAFAAGVLAASLVHPGDISCWLRLGHITAMSALAQASDVGQVASRKITERLLSLSPEEWNDAELNMQQHDRTTQKHDRTTQTDNATKPGADQGESC